MTAGRSTRLAIAVLGLLFAVVLVVLYLSLSAPGKNAPALVLPSSGSAPTEGPDISSMYGEPLPDTVASSDINQLCPDAASLIRDARGVADSEYYGRREQKDVQDSRQLAASDSPELLLVAAVLSDDLEVREEILDRLLSADVNDAALLSGALAFCPTNETVCLRHRLYERLAIVDPENSFVWSRLAMQRYESSDLDGALTALERAVRASQTNSYWTEHIEIIERALASVPDRPFFDRAGTAFAYSASLVPSYQPLFRMCSDEAPASGEWAGLCLRFADKLATQGDTLLGRKIGDSLEETLRSELGIAGPKERVSGLTPPSLPDAPTSDIVNIVLTTQPSFFVRFLELARTHGELVALDQIEREAIDFVSANRQAFCETVKAELRATPEIN